MKTAKILLAILCMVLMAGQVMATPVSFGDSVVYWPGYASSQSGDNAQDVIGSPQITGGSLELGPAGELLSVSIDYTSSSEYIAAGDLFIDRSADGTWDYVLKTYDWNGDVPNPDAVSPDTVAVIYDLSSVSDTRVSNGNLYHFADEWQPTGLNFRDNHPYSLKEGLGVAIGSFDFTDFDDSGAGSVVFSDFSFNSGYSVDLGSEDFILGFGSTCANDVIYETVNNPVPIPGSVFLFAPGLLGLVGLRRKVLTS